jgi:hypothetical protein
MVGLRLLRSLVPPYSLTLTLFLKLTTKRVAGGFADHEYMVPAQPPATRC